MPREEATKYISEAEYDSLPLSLIHIFIANMVNLAIRLSVALICAPRFGIAFVWLAVPAGWLANFLISYAALRRSWPEDKAAVSQ